MKALLIVFLAAAALLLAACATAESQSSPEIASVLGAAKEGTDWCANEGTLERELRLLISEYRAENGLSGLSCSPILREAAEWMSQDMAEKDYFSHTDSMGRDPFSRMSDFGYTFNVWRGENLVAGAVTPQQALELWKASPTHNEVLLLPHFKVVGIALVRTADAAFCCYWTADFGGYNDKGSSTCLGLLYLALLTREC